jgi:hypothetical protein
LDIQNSFDKYLIAFDIMTILIKTLLIKMTFLRTLINVTLDVCFFYCDKSGHLKVKLVISSQL